MILYMYVNYIYRFEILDKICDSKKRIFVSVRVMYIFMNELDFFYMNYVESFCVFCWIGVVVFYFLKW